MTGEDFGLRLGHLSVAQVQDSVEDGAVVGEVRLFCERQVLGHGLSEDGIEQPPALAAVHGT